MVDYFMVYNFSIWWVGKIVAKMGDSGYFQAKFQSY